MSFPEKEIGSWTVKREDLRCSMPTTLWVLTSVALVPYCRPSCSSRRADGLDWGLVTPAPQLQAPLQLS